MGLRTAAGLGHEAARKASPDEARLPLILSFVRQQAHSVCTEIMLKQQA